MAPSRPWKRSSAASCCARSRSIERALERVEDFDRDRRGLGRAFADPHALRLERLFLRRGGAGGAGDDRAGVAHLLARGGGEAGDVGDHRLGDLGGDELGGALLGVAADLADHHDHLRVRVGLVEAEDVDEVRTDDRVAADPDDRGVAGPRLLQLVADLVGQRPALGDDADRARVEELGGDDADVGLAGREHAGAVRPDQPHAGLLRLPIGLQHVEHRNSLGDRDHRLDPGLDRLVDRRRGEARRDEDHRGIGARLLHRLPDRVEDRHSLDVLTALAGRDAGDEVGPVGLVAEAVEGALAAGQAGDGELRRAVDDDAHDAPPASSTTRRAASSIVFSWCRFGRSASARIRSPSSELVPSRRTTSGIPRSICWEAVTIPLAISSQRVMPPKMLKRIALTFASLLMTSSALTIASALEPPPASRKLAGAPPAWATTSSVDMQRLAPLARMPTLPSSLT